jgi:hypothetical protein
VEAFNFFKELLCTRHVVVNSVNEDVVPGLEDEAAAELSKPDTKKEVYDALMSMKSYKALRPDCFQPIFFKLFWRILVTTCGSLLGW